MTLRKFGHHYIGGLTNFGLFGTYSTVPNRRSYLNNSTYPNLTMIIITIPTLISIPIRNSVMDRLV